MRRAAALLLLVLLSLTACSDDEPAPPRAGGSPTASPTASPELPAQDLVADLLRPEVQPDPQAEVAGTITVGQKAVPVVADVLEVRAGETSTLLRWRLRSRTAERVGTFGSSMSRPGLQDTRGIRLQTAEAVLQPYTYEGPAGGAFQAAGDLFCACSSLPTQVGADGVLMYAMLPPLTSGAATLDVLLPGFAPAAGIAVSR